jgi:hypothetical protein
MPAFVGNKQVEAYEWITNRDLVDSAHLLMGGIDLDPASSEMANTYVNAKNFYTVMDDGLNDQDWHGSVYLFPPNKTYFWNAKSYRWKATRGLSPTLISGHASLVADTEKEMVEWRGLTRDFIFPIVLICFNTVKTSLITPCASYAHPRTSSTFLSK